LAQCAPDCSSHRGARPPKHPVYRPFMKQSHVPACCAWILSAAILTGSFLAVSSSPASIIFDDFNLSEGHFNSDPNLSGSSLNDAATSDATLATGGSPLEGAGFQAMVFDWEDNADAGVDIRIRHLSGGGTPANNTSFTTSAGVDGWIGFYLRTTTSGWTAQLWIEGPENNGGVPKTIIADGAWHLYEWNLDDQTGGPDGWGAVAGIVAGDADVQDGTYTIDSIIFRDSTTLTSSIDLDFVAKSDSGSISSLVPEPSSGFMGLAGLMLLVRRRR
jgi:MYXO-CTERM domain-containing protein